MKVRYKTMKMKFSINGTKVTRKHVLSLVGKERLDRMIKESIETMREDPLIENDYYLGMSIGMLTIEMDPWS